MFRFAGLIGLGACLPLAAFGGHETGFVAPGAPAGGLGGPAAWIAAPGDAPGGASDDERLGITEHFLAIEKPNPFLVEGALKRNVDFWVQVYTRYSTTQGLIHDAKHVDRVYEVIDFTDSPRSRKELIRASKARWRKALLSLASKGRKGGDPPDPSTLDADEARVFQLFQGIDETDKYRAAAHRRRLRFQLGQKDRFVSGLYESGRYLPEMERIFKAEGIPIELTRLPFVESSFNTRARSKVGASGIWQFMRSTGRLFLKINSSVDERNDPLRATEAAARLLRVNYQSLGSWPLAVTAYNHGRQGMMRAVRKVGSVDLEDVMEEYRSRSFGFASSNFFAELVAAIQVETRAEDYFGKVPRARLEESFEVELPRGIRLTDLCSFLSLDAAKVRALNPGLTDSVLGGKKRMPASYRLRLPLAEGKSVESARRVFLAGFEEIPAMYK